VEETLGEDVREDADIWSVEAEQMRLIEMGM
jgi:hypothetical protein